MAPEKERAWEPIPGAWPPVEEQVDEFLEEAVTVTQMPMLQELLAMVRDQDDHGIRMVF